MNKSSKISILYIDDEHINLLAFRANFRREYEVFTAVSGIEGKALIEQNDIKIVVADQRMPKMTGIQFFEWIKEDHPNTIRILLTGFTDVSAVVDAINKGQVYSYISKPWDEEELRGTFEKAFKEHQRKAYSLSIESRFNQLFDYSSDAILVMNEITGIVNANKVALELYKYELDEIGTIPLDQLVINVNNFEELMKVFLSGSGEIIDKFQRNISCDFSIMKFDPHADSSEFFQVLIKKT